MTGLDFPEDGRAFAAVDFDQDGDLDLIAKFRNAPQLRLLRNDTPSKNHGIAFRLEGAQEKGTTGFATSRDAVGAVIELATPQGKRVKQVTLGQAFLSQPPLTVTFGLGERTEPVDATIHWPSGRRQSLAGLPVDHRITVREGKPDWRATPFRKRNGEMSDCAPQPVPRPGVRPEGYPFLEPVPVPAFELATLAGQRVTQAGLQGHPALINFWATWCAPCQEEMRLWKQHYADIRAAGAELVAVSVDVPEDTAQVEAFARERELPFPVLRMDEQTLERYNVFYRRLFERRTDLQIPTTFLLDAQGRLVKLYRGIVSIDTLLADLRTLREAPQELARTGLPYPGRRFLGGFSRDYYHLGAAFFERGLLEDAAFYLETAVATHPKDAESWQNLGVVYGEMGRLGRAREALEQAVALQPASAGAHFNLGIAYMRLEQPARAETAFERAAALDPSDPGKLLQYANLLVARGKGAQAIPVLEDYLKLEPRDARGHSDLGALLAQRGDLARATESLRRATELDPDFAGAFRHLGIVYLQRRLPFRAVEALEQAVRLNPQDTDAHFALADGYLRIGRRSQAEKMLERVLELDPGHPQARRILRQLRQPPGR